MSRSRRVVRWASGSERRWLHLRKRAPRPHSWGVGNPANTPAGAEIDGKPNPKTGAKWVRPASKAVRRKGRNANSEERCSEGPPRPGCASERARKKKQLTAPRRRRWEPAAKTVPRVLETADWRGAASDHRAERRLEVAAGSGSWCR